MNGTTTAQILLTADDRTKATFAAVGRNVTSLSTTVGTLVGRFAGLATGVGAILAAVGAAKNIAILDQLDDLSEKTGISVEKLSELRYAGEATGTPLDALAGGVGRLSRLMAEVAGGNKEAAATFKTIGVEAKNADGTLRASEDVLGDIADRFASYEDGAAKAALAQQIFGKSGAEMIPLLNQGREGIERLRLEAVQLGAVYSGDMAKDAAAFNDNLVKLKIAAEAAAIKVGGPLVASLKDATSFFLEATKQGGLFKALLVSIGAGVARVVGADDVGVAKGKAKDAAAEIQRLQGVMQGLELTLERDPGNAVAQRRMGSLRTQVQAQMKLASEASEQLKNLANGMDPVASPGKPAAEVKPKGQAPVVPTASGAGRTPADNTDQLLRKALDSELKAIRAQSEERRMALEFGNVQAEAAYRDGLTSLETYLARQAKTRQDGLATELEALDAEAKAIANYQSRVSNPVAKEDAANKIAENAAKRTLAIQAAGYADQRALNENARAAEQLRDRYDDLRASILAAQGNTRAGAQTRIDQQVRDAGRLATQAGDEDPARVEAVLRARLEGEADLSEVQRAHGLLVEAAANAEERLTLEARERGDSELTTLRAIGVARQASLAQLGELAAKARELAAALGTPEAIAYAERLAVEFKRATAAVDPLLAKLRQTGEEAASVIADGLADAALSGKSLISTLKDIDKQLAQIALNELFTKPLKNMLTDAIGGNGQTSGGGGWIGQVLGALGRSAGQSGGSSSAGSSGGSDLLAGLAKSAASSSTSSDWMSSIGTWISGLASFDVGTSYVPEDMVAKIHKGERIVRAQDNKPGFGGTSVIVNQSFAPGTDRSTVNQAARSASEAMRSAQRFR